MTQFSDANRTSIRYAFETQWGVPPTNGVTRAMRITNSSIERKKTTVKTTEIRPDRMVGNIVETAAMTDGNTAFELSAGSQDDFMQAFLCGTWSRPMTFDKFQGSTIAWTSATTITVSGQGDASPYFIAGRRVKTQGFILPGNNGFWSIVSAVTVAGVTTVTVTGAYAAAAEVGSPAARLMDANDILVLNNIAIRAGTAGVASFDSNGSNAFASAILAGQLVTGQQVHVDGLGYETATITFSGPMAVGDSVKITDGTTGTFEFIAGTDFIPGASGTTTAIALASAICAARVKGKTISFSLQLLSMTAQAVGAVLTVQNLLDTAGVVTSGVNTAAVQTIVPFTVGNTTAHGIYTLLSATNDTLFVNRPVATINNTTVAVTVRASMLRNPGDYRKIVTQSFSVETGFTDVGQYFLANGLRVGGITLDVVAGQLVKGQVDFMGGKTTVSQATKFGSLPFTALDTTTTDNLNATTNVGSLTKNGVTLSTALKDIKLNMKAALRNQEAVSSKYPVGIGTGQLTISGSIEAYFSTLDLYNNFDNHDTISLAFSFTDSDGNYSSFTLPAIKITSDPIVPGGIDQDVFEKLAFEAFRDPQTQCMIQIDRFSSVRPIGS